MTAPGGSPTAPAARRSRRRWRPRSCATAGITCVLTTSGGATAFYVDGALVHAGAGAGSAPAAMPWHVMRNGGVGGQFARGRADEIAIHGTALDAATVRTHFEAGRDVADTAPPAAPAGLTASERLGRVVLDWADGPEPDLDGYDVFRAPSPAGPFTRVNAARLSTSAYTDASVTGGTGYVYVVAASDIANHRSADSAPVSATPPSAEELLRRYAPELRYEIQESYFADSAAELTDNFVAGSRQNFLVGAGGERLAAANPVDPLANLSLGLLGDPLYADGRAAGTDDYLDAANGTYQQDAQRLRAAGYGDRVYGRVAGSGGRTWLQYWFSPTTTRRTCSASACTRATGSSRRWASTPTASLRSPPLPSTATASAAPGARCAGGRRGAGGLCRARLARFVLHGGREPARALSRRQPSWRRLPRAPGARGRDSSDFVHGLARTLGRVVLESDRAAPPGQLARPGRLPRHRDGVHRDRRGGPRPRARSALPGRRAAHLRAPGRGASGGSLSLPRRRDASTADAAAQRVARRRPRRHGRPQRGRPPACGQRPARPAPRPCGGSQVRASAFARSAERAAAFVTRAAARDGGCAGSSSFLCPGRRHARHLAGLDRLRGSVRGGVRRPAVAARPTARRRVRRIFVPRPSQRRRR